jgi:HEAT repeat protein
VAGLRYINDESGNTALLVALKDENDDVRELAVDALGSIRKASAIPGLIEIMKNDENSDVRGCAARALGDIGVPAIPALIEILKDEELRLHAAEELVFIGVPAIPSLSGGLKDGNCGVREYAAIALGNIAMNNRGDAEILKALHSLVEALTDEDQRVRDKAAWALENILQGFKTIEQIIEIEKQIDESYRNLTMKHGGLDRVSVKPMELIKVRLAAAQRKNELASKRDIILDGIPKPPKRGGHLYQSTRMIRNG